MSVHSYEAPQLPSKTINVCLPAVSRSYHPDYGAMLTCGPAQLTVQAGLVRGGVAHQDFLGFRPSRARKEAEYWLCHYACWLAAADEAAWQDQHLATPREVQHG